MEEIKLSDLVPDEHNANRGTERGRYMLEQSLRKLGAGRSIVLDKHGRIIAGNKTAEIAADLDLEDVVVVRTSGNKLVAVLREDLDLDDPTGTARELAYADNRTGQVSLDFDPDVIAADIEIGLDLGDWWQDFELEEIGATPPPPPEEDAEPQTSRAEELREEWGVELGQLWRLPSRTPGQEHRLICGDCTDAAVVDRVMGGDVAAFCFTDPPYGVEYTGGTKKWPMLENDNEVNMYAASLPVIKKFVEDKAALYLAFASANARSVYNTLADNGYIQRALIIWNKNHAQFGAMGAQYKQKHEPVAYCYKSGFAPYWFGPNNEVTVWDIDRQAANEYHPTQKPPELYMRAIRNSAPENCIILEPFCGSATAIIAAENLARQCRAVEISPAYVAVSLQRYKDAFGIEPELIS